MKRNLEKDLLSWRGSPRRKPLIIRGARQVGKTHSIQFFGENHFSGQLVTVNLEKHPDWHRIFLKNLDAKRILAELELLTTSKIIPGKTLLFLDEIQACPRAIMALRYFYEEVPDLHVVAAGSLLDFALSEISFPVGRVQSLWLGPLTFAEYLMAMGKNLLLQTLEEAGRKKESLEETAHNLLLETLKEYLFVGGMPEAVKVYRDTASLHESQRVQQEIVHTYRQDFSKYAGRADTSCLDLVLKGVARNIGNQIIYSHLAEGFSVPTIRKAFDLLCRANVIHKVTSVSPSGLPLGASSNAKRFKAILVDIGLLHPLSAHSVSEEWSKTKLLSLYEGRLAEQFVGQELRSTLDELFYWSRAKRGSSAEVDYMISHEGRIYPIEVKAGEKGRLKSMHLLLKSYPDIPEGLVMSERPYSQFLAQKLKFLPLYTTSFVAQHGLFL